MKLKIEKGQYDEQCMAVYYTSHFALMVKALNVGHQGRSTVYILFTGQTMVIYSVN